ncbi:dihydroxy-acid dehydratase [Streptomyces caniscabiei]|uniref:dihydroxy-acid dehydratase domain-containing protein n=1 Tax=Streptomyces caniscabiei TaxID=2746961 RepID=UPI0029A6B8D6|nr:dihydroxy-acid dehydratase [Streptomyces caniscabiei]MDX2604267.1 dihydroxy-acid dehydratase [Streptomyces caniscabiei]MDX2735609.1 dihydroxy-acid dehydratase [Streptomyces caniscabiei]MDX2781909.1 dihydroxy-acid dehydratase [Streptomyces caniscabiei]
MSESSSQEEWRPGQDCQAVATARALGQDVDRIHGTPWGVVGTLGDSICYVGVNEKVEAIQAAMGRRIEDRDLPVRLLAPNYSGGISDGQRNGTPQMRYSLIGRETTNDGLSLHFEGSDIRGVIAVVACDKPPVGTTAAIMERNVPAVVLSDGSIRPGTDPLTGETIDLVSCFQVAGDPDAEKRERWARNACPGHGSCGGMFTYNTMQSFIALLGLEPLHMVSPASEDPRRVDEFPEQLVDCLETMTQRGITPRDLATPAAFRNATIVAIAMGGSTNVVLHAPEIARAAGIDFWTEVMSQQEFNELSRTVPVLVNARPFGKYSMVDIDAVGGLPVIVKELLDRSVLDGSTLTCTGETLAEQIVRLDPPAPDGEVVFGAAAPFKPTGGLRLLSGNIAPKGGAVIKLAGVETGITDNRFVGRARVFDSEQDLLAALIDTPDVFADQDMVVIRYEGPRGAPGMPEMLDPTSRITALCRQKGISVGLMTDARFSGGSVGLVIGHVGPEAALGGPIALIEDGDTITVGLDHDTLDCAELADSATFGARQQRWRDEAAAHGGEHPHVRPVVSRLLRRMRASASTALEGAGMATPSGTQS